MKKTKTKNRNVIFLIFSLCCLQSIYLSHNSLVSFNNNDIENNYIDNENTNNANNNIIAINNNSNNDAVSAAADAAAAADVSTTTTATADNDNANNNNNNNKSNNTATKIPKSSTTTKEENNNEAAKPDAADVDRVVSSKKKEEEEAAVVELITKEKLKVVAEEKSEQQLVAAQQAGKDEVTAAAVRPVMSAAINSETIKRKNIIQKEEEKKEYNGGGNNSIINKEEEEEVEIQNEKEVSATAASVVVVSFFDKKTSAYNNNNNNNQSSCYISIENVTFMGCGEEGHIFYTEMNCNNINTSTTTTTTTTSTTRSNNNDNAVVVLKVSTTKPSNKEMGYICTEKSTFKMERMYQTLFPPPPSDDGDGGGRRKSGNNMRKHFHLPMGSAQIPVDKLYSTLSNNITQVNQICGQLIHYNQQQQNILKDLVVTGTIMDVAKGKPLSDYLPTNSTAANATTTTNNNTNNVMQPRRRRRRRNKIIIISQLICIWKYMYQHRFSHEDMGLRHIHWDENNNHIGLVDFQSGDMLDDYDSSDEGSNTFSNSGNRKHYKFVLRVQNNNKIRILLQIIQQYQLMTIIANVCMDQDDYMGIPWSNNGWLNSNLIWDHNKNWKLFNKYGMGRGLGLTKLQSAMKVCDDEFIQEFQKQQPSSSSLFSFNSSYFDVVVAVNKSNVSDAIPSLLYSHYQQVAQTNNTRFVDDDVDDDIVGHIYDILSQWASGGGGGDGDSGRC